MGQLKDISKIKQLADRIGTPLLYTDHDNGITFVYKEGDMEVPSHHPSESQGIDDEITRLTRHLKLMAKI